MNIEKLIEELGKQFLIKKKKAVKRLILIK